jgi:alpha-1,2-mannosyltransferase
MTTADFLRERIIFAKLAAIILWLSYALSLAFGDTHGTFNYAKELTAADHLAWYTAARFVTDGHAERMYDHDSVLASQRSLFAEGRWDRLMAYRNPPFYCLAYVPICRLPFVFSAAIAGVVSVGLLWCGVRWLGGDRMAFLWLLAFYPTFCVLSYGQNTLISFAILAAAYRLLKRDRIFTAGLVAGLLWFKPTMLLGVVVWGLLDFRRLWRAAVGVVVMGVVLVATSYAIVPTAWHAFVTQLSSNAAFANFEQWKLHNPLGFARLLFPNAERWHWPFATLCSVVACGWFVQLRRSCKHDVATMFGAVALLTLWASPHAMIYEWGLLGVTAILWWPKLAAWPDRRLILYATTWLVFLLSTHASQFQLRGLGVALQLSVPVVAVVAIVASRMLRRVG